MIRATMAFFLAPFPGALLQSIVVAIWPKDGQGVFEHPASMFVAMCILFYGVALVLGTPALILMRRRNHRKLRDYVLLGLGIFSGANPSFTLLASIPGIHFAIRISL